MKVKGEGVGSGFHLFVFPAPFFWARILVFFAVIFFADFVKSRQKMVGATEAASVVR